MALAALETAVAAVRAQAPRVGSVQEATGRAMAEAVPVEEAMAAVEMALAVVDSGAAASGAAEKARVVS
eukprot:3102751-Prymnesium_polylepis.1